MIPLSIPWYTKDGYIATTKFCRALERILGTELFIQGVPGNAKHFWGRGDATERAAGREKSERTARVRLASTRGRSYLSTFRKTQIITKET